MGYVRLKIHSKRRSQVFVPISKSSFGEHKFSRHISRNRVLTFLKSTLKHTFDLLFILPKSSFGSIIFFKKGPINAPFASKTFLLTEIAEIADIAENANHEKKSPRTHWLGPRWACGRRRNLPSRNDYRPRSSREWHMHSIFRYGNLHTNRPFCTGPLVCD